MIHKSYYISRSVDCSHYIQQIASIVSEYTTLENATLYELLRSNSTRGVRETASLFNFIKIFAHTYYTLCIFIRSIYMFSFFYSAFSQTSPSTSSKPRILMRKNALTSIVYKFLNIGIVVRPVFHVQIAIGNNRGNHIFIPLCYMKDVH